MVTGGASGTLESSDTLGTLEFLGTGDFWEPWYITDRSFGTLDPLGTLTLRTLGGASRTLGTLNTLGILETFGTLGSLRTFGLMETLGTLRIGDFGELWEP